MCSPSSWMISYRWFRYQTTVPPMVCITLLRIFHGILSLQISVRHVIGGVAILLISFLPRSEDL